MLTRLEKEQSIVNSEDFSAENIDELLEQAIYESKTGEKDEIVSSDCLKELIRPKYEE